MKASHLRELRTNSKTMYNYDWNATLDLENIPSTISAIPFLSERDIQLSIILQ